MSSATKTYRLISFWRKYMVGFLCLALGMAGVFVWLGLTTPRLDGFTQALLFIFSGVVAGLGLFFTVLEQRIHLVVSPAGLEMQAIGYRVRSTWEHVVGYQAAPDCDGLSMRDPVVGLEGWFAGLLPISRPVMWLSALAARYRPVPDLAGVARCVPVRAFARDYEHSALAKELARHIQERSGALVNEA